jgi:hypothetical protein
MVMRYYFGLGVGHVHARMDLDIIWSFDKPAAEGPTREEAVEMLDSDSDSERNSVQLEPEHQESSDSSLKSDLDLENSGSERSDWDSGDLEKGTDDEEFLGMEDMHA